nr:methylated-DNA--[protein]-cysteine S-methyltransferase [Pedococcus badiiscoriae]
MSGDAGRIRLVRSHLVTSSPLGELTLVAQDGALVACLMDLPDRHPSDESLGVLAEDGSGDPVLGEAAAQLTEYFARERTEFSLPLAPEGDDFQQRVWALLCEIPYGQTRSYGDLARVLGDVNLSQRVGWANGRNPISIIVPCHRVIGADGALVGYAGGLERKRFLLGLEEPPADEADRLF